jgi:hypothetical protein
MVLISGGAGGWAITWNALSRMTVKSNRDYIREKERGEGETRCQKAHRSQRCHLTTIVWRLLVRPDEPLEKRDPWHSDLLMLDRWVGGVWMVT